MRKIPAILSLIYVSESNVKKLEFKNIEVKNNDLKKLSKYTEYPLSLPTVLSYSYLKFKTNLKYDIEIKTIFYFQISLLNQIGGYSALSKQNIQNMFNYS